MVKNVRLKYNSLIWPDKYLQCEVRKKKKEKKVNTKGERNRVLSPEFC